MLPPALKRAWRRCAAAVQARFAPRELPPAQQQAAPVLELGDAVRVAADRVHLGHARSHRLVPPLSDGALPPGASSAAAAGPAGAHDDLTNRLRLVLQPAPELLLRSTGPLTWPAPLRRYQRHGVMALLARPGLLLADDMGLGKTVQVLAALRLLAFRGDLSCALLVCPAAVVLQWQRELKRWAPELQALTVSGPAAERRILWRRPAHLDHALSRADLLRAIRVGPASAM